MFEQIKGITWSFKRPVAQIETTTCLEPKATKSNTILPSVLNEALGKNLFSSSRSDERSGSLSTLERLPNEILLKIMDYVCLMSPRRFILKADGKLQSRFPENEEHHFAFTCRRFYNLMLPARFERLDLFLPTPNVYSAAYRPLSFVEVLAGDYDLETNILRIKRKYEAFRRNAFYVQYVENGSGSFKNVEKRSGTARLLTKISLDTCGS